jgi:hypothetical protein
MSTDISHGFRLKPGIEPFDFITRVREVMDPARDAADAKLLAGLYTEAIDRDWFVGKPIEAGAGYTAWREWHLEQSKMSSMERRHDPNEFGVQIGQDPLTRDYYLLVITYNPDLREAFEAMDEVAEYGYWNSTDSYPEGVTRADWEVREALWDRIIPGRGRSNMMTFNLRHASDGGVRRLLGTDGEDTSLVFGQLPSDRERAKTVALQAYASFLSKEQGMDVMDAFNHVFFGRSTNLDLVIEVAIAHLLPITPELVTDGTNGVVIDPGYAEAMQAACGALAGLDKDKLTR